MISGILFILGVLIVGIVVLILRGLYLAQPTQGEKIKPTVPSYSALLVIDMQYDTINNPVYQNTSQLLKRIKTEIATAKEMNLEIIYIKQVFNQNLIDFILSGKKYQKNHQGSKLIDELCDSTSKVFTKFKNDSFSSKEFEAYLQEEHIQSLTIVGADISACISATSLGAIHRGYSVTLLTDSIFSVNTKVFQNALAKLSSKGIQLKSSLSNN